ncbi:MAG TPA: 30S ribosomal protein S12 methylthiotransferase RimO [Gammaproteobacteria bacterium]|jgi:ribosomal protein S12 methylthiotransferase|nr:30S ribosomal protein S12 methylthiotransferase RimO [Gammaproteobacteria bacterium]
MVRAAETLAQTPPRIGFVSLGCPKALVDSERILTQLRIEGYEVVGGYSEADVVVVNTCGFIEAAQQESLDAIGEALAENGKVIVTGCLGMREPLIRERFPDVLAITGPHDYEAVMRAVHAQLAPPPRNPYVDLIPASGIKLTPRHYAYLKISEGCNHKCSFCIIPKLRGKLVSRPIVEVMHEAEKLVKDGVKELLVVSQDTSAYGVDLRYAAGNWRDKEYRAHMTDLCSALGELGVWVRLHYVYPYPHVNEVIPLMAEGRVLPYMDIPLQHASPTVLKAMRRPAAGEKALKRIQEWRRACPDLTLRSTFIVGFPGESEQDFAELLTFIREAELDRVGCFAYSPVGGADANALPGHVPAELAEERRARFMQAQAGISRARLKRFMGRELQVLVDSVDGAGAVARSYADAPEIDGVVRIVAAGKLKAGQFAKVRVTGADEYDLEATLA